MKKIKVITTCLNALSILLILWAGLSWLDVVLDNTNGMAMHHSCNLFVLLTKLIG